MSANLMSTALTMAGACASGNLRRAARAVTRHYDAYFEDCRISAVQVPILAAIVALPEATVTSIATAVDLERSSVSRELRTLERDELITIERGRDRRTRVVRLTHRGTAEFGKVARRWEKAHRAFQRSLATDSATALEHVRTLGRAGRRATLRRRVTSRS